MTNLIRVVQTSSKKHTSRWSFERWTRLAWFGTRQNVVFAGYVVGATIVVSRGRGRVCARFMDCAIREQRAPPMHNLCACCATCVSGDVAKLTPESGHGPCAALPR